MFQELRSNVVVTANQFNPSILSQLWLVKKNIVSENEFLRESVFTSDAVQVVTKRFVLAVMEPQLQFFPRVGESKWSELSNDVLWRLIAELPETPYSAIGINFVAQIVPSNRSIEELERRLFVVPSLPLASDFDSADSHFGGYYSKDIFGCRLRLEIKPSTIQTENGPEVRLQMTFNYHRDLDVANAVDGIKSHLENFDDALHYTHSLIQKALTC